MTITFKDYPCGTISLGTSVTRIPNSYRIKSIQDMEDIINRSREEVNKSPAFHTFAINKRTTAGMIIEWRAHNMLYATPEYIPSEERPLSERGLGSIL